MYQKALETSRTSTQSYVSSECPCWRLLSLHLAQPDLLIGQATLKHVSEMISKTVLQHHTLAEYTHLISEFKKRYPRDEDLLRVLEQFDLRIAGSLGYIMMHQNNGLSALQKLSTYANLMSSFDQFFVNTSPEYAYIRHASHMKVPGSYSDSLLKSLILIKMFLELWGHEKIHHVSFGFPEPENVAVFKENLNLSLEFGAEATIIFLDSSVLTQPLPNRDETLAQSIELLVSRVMPSQKSETYSERVCSFLFETEDEACRTLNTAAERLSLTPRTLQRRLKSEGVSFSNLVESVQKEHAAALLLCSDVPIPEISNCMGFADQSSFYRAFRSWFGTTPASYRAKYRFKT